MLCVFVWPWLFCVVGAVLVLGCGVVALGGGGGAVSVRVCLVCWRRWLCMGGCPRGGSSTRPGHWVLGSCRCLRRVLWLSATVVVCCSALLCCVVCCVVLPLYARASSSSVYCAALLLYAPPPTPCA